MESQTMSSAFAEFKIYTSDAEVGSSRIRGASTGKEIASGNLGAQRKIRALRDANRIDARTMRGRHDGKIWKNPPPPPRGEEEEEEEEEDAIPMYRKAWETCFGGVFGSFEDETTLAPMRYTSGPIPKNAVPGSTLQVFSVRIANLKGGLRWPLHVYGFLATRDSADHNRNFLFRRTRDNCQILTEEDPVLLLTGPSRAIVFVDLITFEAQLKVKGTKTESEDEVLASKVFHFHQGSRREDGIRTCIPYKRCMLEFAFAPLLRSVEATISVQVVDGSWPDDHQGRVFSCTAGVKNTKMMLLDCPDGNMPISSDGLFELSRRVVSVEFSTRNKLTVYVQAYRVGFLTRAKAVFEPKKSGTSIGMCDLRFCKMQVTVAWSLLSTLAHMPAPM
ncbi:uncharacterized protein LOC124665625 [Lolium rigidum]|uniref:uncharacterized protein LOC124665625 n=1 Tax=Lolium rigidum TaxID=89674 RepID=UPI001F5C132D|nr:uncharacterized protein LOC124665625 [Lolium rigidum]